MSIPHATMRLQFHRDFTFADATQLVPYMAGLGISHLYASPILTARPGSMHGYDVVDPTQVNPELGGEAGLRSLVAALHAAGLGLIVDIVPNHMAAGGLENPWWGDVLRHGRSSQYATFFDIDWDTSDPSLQGKVLAPFLGKPYGEALRSGEITLSHQDGCPVIRYFDMYFPIRPEDFSEISGFPSNAYDPMDAVGSARLHRLLERQNYRLAWWRCGGDEINWRRFFDINGLAALRVEDAAVFEATHATLFRLYHEDLLDGFRIDHVDGLTDPPGYCRRLRQRLEEIGGPHPVWIVVEKILGNGEGLPDDWAVDGTSGYDFMDEVSALLHDASGQAPLQELWHTLSGRPTDLDIEETTARREVLERSFSAQLEATAAELHRLARAELETVDTTHAAIRRALVALLTQFRVYRTYGSAPSEAFAAALARATATARPADRPVLALLDRLLEHGTDAKAATRFQQLSAPLAAKALEDTSYYRNGTLLSRNEVGADSSRFSMTVSEFHAACLRRCEHFPDAMLATATHDHKRGEDVRSRLAVLSEIPNEWAATVRHWFELNASHRRSGPMPSAGDEAMLYQMIVGAWPNDLDAADGDRLQNYAERLAAWQLKAMREAKLATDWIEPNLEYEDAARSFVYTIMSDTSGFVAEAARFVERIAPVGAVNSLAQTLLKLTVPGVPDIYQGADFWDLSMVDPDNRRPVDFARRIDALHADSAPSALARHWQDGRVKQALIRRTLSLRRQVPELFARGKYRPLEVSGELASHIVAFARSHADAHCVVVVPRLVAGLALPSSWQGLAPPSTSFLEIGEQDVVGRHKAGHDGEGADVWRDTRVRLPNDLAGREMQDQINGGCLNANKVVPIDRLLGHFPVALLAT